MFCRSEIRSIIIDSCQQVSTEDELVIDGSTDLSEIGIDSLDFTALIIEIEDRLPDLLSADTLDEITELELFTVDTVTEVLSRNVDPSGCSCPLCKVVA